jgi:hypothetical protein
MQNVQNQKKMGCAQPISLTYRPAMLAEKPALLKAPIPLAGPCGLRPVEHEGNRERLKRLN